MYVIHDMNILDFRVPHDLPSSPQQNAQTRAMVPWSSAEAAKDAQIYEALSILPQQFDTFVGLGGAHQLGYG